MSNQLSKAERAELDECEQGIMDCVENIGMYLLRIRDKRLIESLTKTLSNTPKSALALPSPGRMNI